MRNRWRLLAICCCLGILPAKGQLDSVRVYMEKIKAATTDSLKLEYADSISEWLKELNWESPTMESPVKYLGYKKWEKPEAELFSWAVPLLQGSAFYNLFRFRATGLYYLIRSLPLKEKEAQHWLYYDGVPFEKQGKIYFMLLGWNRSRQTNRKIVQVVRFEDNGAVSYEHPLIRRGNSRSASLRFEYAGDGSMMLKHDRKGKRIIFDHLAPAEKRYEGYFMFYGADASYDALVLKRGEWWYEENVKENNRYGRKR